MRAFEEAGNVRSACNQRINLADAIIQLGLYERAESELRRALEIAERLRIHAMRGLSILNLGVVVGRLGRLTEACALEAEAIALCRAFGDLRLESGAHVYQANNWLKAGDVKAAEDEARLALSCAGESPAMRAYALAMLARVELADGRVEEALGRTREAMAILQARGQIDEGESMLRLVHAEALDRAGDRPAARDAIAAAQRRLVGLAAAITDAATRACFLTAVEEHARTFELARAWGVDASLATSPHG